MQQKPSPVQKNQKEGKSFVSQDAKKLNNFYSFKVDQQKFTQIKKNSNKQILRFAITGVIFGFFTEWLLGNGQIYENIVKKSTMRRLNAKKKQDLRLLQRAQKRGQLLQ